MNREDVLKRFIRLRTIQKKQVLAQRFMKAVGADIMKLQKSFYYHCRNKVDLDTADDIFQETIIKCYNAIKLKGFNNKNAKKEYYYTAYFTKALNLNLINYINKETSEARKNNSITLDTEKYNNEEFFIIHVSPKRIDEVEEPEINKIEAQEQRDDELEAEKRVQKLQIEIAIRKLEPKFQEIMSLHHYDNMKYREIARILSIPMTTVKTRLNQARKLLKIILQNERKKKR